MRKMMWKDDRKVKKLWVEAGKKQMSGIGSRQKKKSKKDLMYI